MAGKSKQCFVVGPIGDDRSDTRDHADTFLKYIVRAALENDRFNYKVDRGKSNQPGSITNEVITKTINADLVVADLTELNPNAFYELGIRHVYQKPTIHMIDRAWKIPFDNQDYNTIQYEIKNPEQHQQAIEELQDQVREVEKKGYIASNPVTAAIGHEKALASGDEQEVQVAKLTEIIATYGRRIADMEEELRRRDRNVLPWGQNPFEVNIPGARGVITNNPLANIMADSNVLHPDLVPTLGLLDEKDDDEKK